MRGGKENRVQQIQRECQTDKKQPARTDETGLKPEEKCQTFTNLTI